MIEEIKFSYYIFYQIKDFDHENLTKEQNLLINNLIFDEELRKRYKYNGLCKECKIPNMSYHLCKCNFRQNFKNWTSGNNDIDKFIQNAQLKAQNHREIIEWIDFDRFKDVKYLAKGGFGITYEAIWKDGYIQSWDSDNNQWKRDKYGQDDLMVALKCLHNSEEFLREIQLNVMINSIYITRCYGITKNPKTNTFMMVMIRARNGSLRQYLNDNFNLLKWNEKLDILRRIAAGLKYIHNNELIHCDFHSGNILNGHNNYTYITDLGLCQLENLNDYNKEIYGVLPYMAPEVLRGKKYTQASDIYGFGIIAYEICTGLPPYYDKAHDELLAIEICQGLRPKVNYSNVPDLVLNIIQRCWDADSLKRPQADELQKLFMKLYHESDNKEFTINKQIKEAGTLPSYTIHPQAFYTSRLLNFNNLPEPINSSDLSSYQYDSVTECYDCKIGITTECYDCKIGITTECYNCTESCDCKIEIDEDSVL